MPPSGNRSQPDARIYHAGADRRNNHGVHEMKQEALNILIIGAGPAGITTAIQLKRYGLMPTLLEKEHVGGLLRNANLVENYPGFPEGIAGPKLIALLEKQIQRIGVDVIFDEVKSLKFEDSWLAETKQAVYQPDVVIIATGTKPLPLPVEVPEQVKKRVFSEVWPLADVENQHVIIIGAGDAAFDYALNLAGRGNTVTILNRGSEVSCLPLLWERARATPAISYREQTTLQRIEGDTQDGRLHLFTDDSSLTTDYMLSAIGRVPQLDFMAESVKLQKRKLMECGKLYFVGDVHNGLFRQTAIAVGEGLRAAIQVYEKMSLQGR
jgi:thioredoxin reductase (NADPH)